MTIPYRKRVDCPHLLNLTPRTLPRSGPHARRTQAGRLAYLELQGGREGSSDVQEGARNLGVVFHQAAQPRWQLLKALLADAILQGRVQAGRWEAFVTVIGAPLISEEMASSLEAYAGEVATGQPFGLVDGRAFIRLLGPGLESVRRELASPKILDGFRLQDTSKIVGR